MNDDEINGNLTNEDLFDEHSDENPENEIIHVDENYEGDELPQGIFTITITDAMLKRMEETAIPMTPELKKAATETVLRILNQVNKGEL